MQRRRLLALAVLGAATLAAGGLAVSAGARAHGPSLPGLMTGKAPWPANNGALLRARLRAIGLPALGQEGTVLHTHQHLDIVVGRTLLPVPAGIGIDAHGAFITELHTHDTSGIIHVESPVRRTFTLGQFFDVWGLRFTRTCIGAYCAGRRKGLWVFVDAKRFRGDPRTIVLRSHEEIVVWYGVLSSIPVNKLPRTYPFPSGY
ncbi:MAG TPA: hypothetical protein VFA44_13305 [Gaiellaceae bacterium]|nr:hypothetical protein [Gaiellaceae bacterium]